MKVDLTSSQIEALRDAAEEVLAGADPDLWPQSKLATLERATERLAATAVRR